MMLNPEHIEINDELVYYTDDELDKKFTAFAQQYGWTLEEYNKILDNHIYNFDEANKFVVNLRKNKHSD